MKRFISNIISICVCFLMILNVASCANKNNSGKSPRNEIVLTTDNIEEYLCFEGDFLNGRLDGKYVYTSEADLEFQVYPLRLGSFRNVKITLIVSSNNSAFERTCWWDGEKYCFGYWHVKGAEEKWRIKLEFKVGVDGRFSKKYEVECFNKSSVLEGAAIFKVAEVSGSIVLNS